VKKKTLQIIEHCFKTTKVVKSKLEILKEIHFPHSIGLLYSAFTYYTGFKVNSGEYKVWDWHHMVSQNKRS